VTPEEWAKQYIGDETFGLEKFYGYQSQRDELIKLIRDVMAEARREALLEAVQEERARILKIMDDFDWDCDGMGCCPCYGEIAAKIEEDKK
jgi:hypothetical protein